MVKSTALLLLLLACSLEMKAQIDPVGSGRALKFDGIDDYIDLGNRYDDLQVPFTVSAWVYIDNNSALPGGPIFVTQDNDPAIYNGFWFSIAPTAIVFEYGDGLGGNNPVFRKGKIASVNNMQNRWTHICGVMRSATSVDIYVNGVNVGGNLSGDSSFPMSSNFPNDVAKIGYFFSNATLYRFNGLMDEVRLFNRALTETEIRDQMCKKLTGTESGLIGYWNFNEVSGNTIMDKSSREYNGQLMNSPTRVYSGAPIGDQSTYLYKSNWTGTKLTMNENSDAVEVSNVLGNPEGVHTYVVRSLPSQTQGLDLSSTTNPYFGVFVAATFGGNSFNVSLSTNGGATCGLSARSDNSVATWTSASSPMTSVMNRTELIKASEDETLVIDLGNDEDICPFVLKTLSPLSDPTGYEFTWQDGSKEPTFQANKYGVYWVKVEKNCSVAVDTIKFTQPKIDDLVIPNVFTPGNGDQLNQYFYIDQRILGSTLVVYNRWGKQVYLSTNYQNDWDGSNLPVGVYYFSLSGPCIDERKGHVSIVR